MRYAEKQRQSFIKETLEMNGFINARDIQAKFEIGSATASKDLGKFKKLNPNAMIYNLSNSRYENTDQDKIVGGITRKRTTSESARAKIRLKDKAYSIVNRAKAKGELIAKGCESCDNKSNSKVQAHHDDYNKPLDVRWLCISCHKTWHYNNKSKP